MAHDLAAGAKAPAFTLPRDGGSSISLKDFKGRHLILYFYPKADTAGCTREAVDFSRLRPAFDWAGTDVPGVSAPEDWRLAVEVLEAVKLALPDANDRRPGETLEFVRAAIRASSAKVIEGDR